MARYSGLSGGGKSSGAECPSSAQCLLESVLWICPVSHSHLPLGNVNGPSSRGLLACRDWTVMALRCALLLQWTSAVTVAMPGAIAGMFSDLLAPWRGQGFVSWAALDFLAAPEPGMPQDLSLLAMLALLSIVLPVR